MSVVKTYTLDPDLRNVGGDIAGKLLVRAYRNGGEEELLKVSADMFVDMPPTLEELVAIATGKAILVGYGLELVLAYNRERS
jgi:hypothetical protein